LGWNVVGASETAHSRRWWAPRQCAAGERDGQRSSFAAWPFRAEPEQLGVDIVVFDRQARIVPMSAQRLCSAKRR
jgi:hypothetical protein